MDEELKRELLEGLDEYYAQRTDLLTESNTPQKTMEINGLTYIQADCTAEEWIKSVGGVNIEDVQWQM